jgi:hypothetical protein
MKNTTLHRDFAILLALLAALGCKDSRRADATKPDGALSGGQGGNSGTGGSVGSDAAPGTGGTAGRVATPGTGGALATGGSTGRGGAGGALTFADASPVEDVSAVRDVPATEPTSAKDTSGSPDGAAFPDGSSVCSLPADPGPCKGNFQSTWYNQATGKCESFVYGGCEGNANRFDSLAACVAACIPDMAICSLPADVGPCDGACASYWYNQATGSCELFMYGCCGGNANRFATLSACASACDPALPSARCDLVLVPEMETVPELAGLLACTSACTGHAPSFAADWTSKQAFLTRQITAEVFRTLSRWSKTKMASYTQVPPLAGVTFSPTLTDANGTTIVFEGVLDSALPSDPLVFRQSILYAVYDTSKTSVTKVIITIRGELQE